jgi:predicted transglutaminase-like cysteine proteinase
MMNERSVRRHAMSCSARDMQASPIPSTTSKRGITSSVAGRMQSLALVALSASAVLLGSQAAVAQDAFLAARMTVSAPAGAHNLCGRYPWACKASGGATRISGHQLDVAIKLNRQINRKVRSIADQAQYGRAEHWALPTARGGDCEDFALIKKKHLIEAGLDPQMLLVSTVLDRNRNAHAVLVMRTGQGDFILDNLRDEVLHWRQTGYTFLRMQDPANPSRWTAVIDGGILRNDNAVSTPRLVQSGAASVADVIPAKAAHSR